MFTTAIMAPGERIKCLLQVNCIVLKYCFVAVHFEKCYTDQCFKVKNTKMAAQTFSDGLVVDILHA